jgi:hypothetical protein
MGIDSVERRFGFFGAALAGVLALFFIPHLLHNTTITVTANRLKSGHCPAGYTLVKSLCTKSEITHPSYWWPQFLIFVVVGSAIAIFSFLRKRAPLIVSFFLVGLATGTPGVVFIALGAWYSVRAFRLNKYGDPTFRGSNIRARELAAQRRAERAAGRPARSSRGRREGSAAPAGPAPSKRYTPKKSQRR